MLSIVLERFLFIPHSLGLDEYFDYKKNHKLNDKVFYALPRYSNDPTKKYIIPESEAFE